ncbi:putative membrane protein [Helicobacter pylori CPY1313]|nr:putative membrane protein [Helicobacter pylori CPY1313]
MIAKNAFILLFFYSFILLFFYSTSVVFISFVFNFLVGGLGLCLNGFCVFRFLEPI